MTRMLLENRRVLYATPGLEEVGDHGGERINKKIQAFARRMSGDAIVASQLQYIKEGRKRVAEHAESSKKPKRARNDKTADADTPSDAEATLPVAKSAEDTKPRKLKPAPKTKKVKGQQEEVNGEWREM